jgi:hypothetical protein
MKAKAHASKLLVPALLLLLVPLHISGQDEKSPSVTIPTPDGLSFTAWVDRQKVRFGQDIIINYRVDNGSNKPIYLVHDGTAYTVIEDDQIVFPEPLVLIGGHEAYNYSFKKVKSGGSIDGEFIVSRDEYKAAQAWHVKVGFGYVTDIRGLTPQPDEALDPAPYKARLDSRIQTLQLSSLKVEVIEK